MKTIVLSICTRNRLHQLRSMMDSVALALPEAQREALLVDDAPGPDYQNTLAFNITQARDLGLSQFKAIAFANIPTAFCCFLKPAFGLYLMQKFPTVERFIYCDADTLWYSQPKAFLEQLEHSDILFTPHRHTPTSKTSVFVDFELGQSGVINAGLFGFSNSDVSRRFLSWWLSSMKEKFTLSGTYAYDQIWLTLALQYFDSIAISRATNINVAYWNIDERPVETSAEGVYLVGTTPLSIFHFSMFNPEKPDLLACSNGRIYEPPNTTIREIVRSYSCRLQSYGRKEELSIPYGYGYFNDGKPIKQVHRNYFEQRFITSIEPDADPFDPKYGKNIRSGILSLYNADSIIKYIYRIICTFCSRIFDSYLD